MRPDPFLAATNCARCRAPLRASMMSKFNTDALCIPCKDDERLAPGYAAADAAEVAAVRGGDFTFPGVGLSAADREFLAGLRATRQT